MEKMTPKEFEERIKIASSRLRVLCPKGAPTEEYIKEATLESGLPVFFPDDPYVHDEVRSTVVVLAYRPPMKVGTYLDHMIANARRWMEDPVRKDRESEQILVLT